MPWISPVNRPGAPRAARYYAIAVISDRLAPVEWTGTTTTPQTIDQSPPIETRGTTRRDD